ncbi:hypothetical protein J4437_01585 [Candidatus Woesearchaeota archaeon]|nr:hypothetical protein [Candidatus Woesearchaeota archaeon]
METITLSRIHEDMIELKKEIGQIREMLEEDLEISDYLRQDIEISRKRPRHELISHADVKKEFGC